MRPIGIAFLPYGDETAEQLATWIKEAGFTTTMVNYETSGEVARAHCRAAVNAGLTIELMHAPFRAVNSMWSPERTEASEAYLAQLFDCLDCCREYGVKYLVMHTSSGMPMPAVNEVGLARFDRLMAYAADCGVTIAYENQRYLDILKMLMERYPQAAFCWDVGHEACFTPGLAFMPLYGHRIACLHLHDNLGHFNQDSHLIPYDGVIDMEQVAFCLKESAYTGSVMLENFYTADKVEQQERYAALSAESYFQRSYAAAVRLRELIDG